MIEASAGERLAAVRRDIEDAAQLAGREPDEVALIAVSKTHDADAILPLIEAGQRRFGENRVQEAQGKWPALKERFPDLQLHLVGQLQSNKAEAAVALFDVIHSLDRPSLVEALARAAERTGRRPDCFIQVDLADEPQKGGCSVGELPGLLDRARGAGLEIVGLMTVPPARLEPAPWFALLAELGRRHDLKRLSMGMSGDFRTAIMIGATDVRIGTALFGDRT